MTSLPPDPYKILGVSKDAQIPEIRSAHRKLVLKCHPDKIQDPELKALKADEFQKVQQAYELLSDENERQKYDDQVKLVELRKQMQQKANISAQRTTTRYAGDFEIRTAEPRPSTYKSSPSMPSPTPGVKTSGYSRSYEDNVGRGPRIFEEFRPRRETSSYNERPSKRELDKERERERDAREREKERERDRRRREEEIARRAEKDAKEARRAEKKFREKERDKERKRETEDKKRHAKPYIEDFSDDMPSKSEKKKSSKKHDEKRERSLHREEIPPSTVSMQPPLIPSSTYTNNLDFAASYIEASRAKSTQRSATFHVQPPAVPTPPPVPGLSSPFAVPKDNDDEEDARRSAAKPRRGSADTARSVRDKAYRKTSREVLEEDPIEGSPSMRHPAHMAKGSPAVPITTGSPPRREVPRTHTMPMDPGYPRPPGPGLARAATFSGAYGETSDPRGRDRSRMHPQIVEEHSDSEFEYDRRRHKHRSGKKNRSPEPPRGETYTYRVGDDNRVKPSFSRRIPDPEADAYSHSHYYPSTPEVRGVRVVEARPAVSRDASYLSSAPKISKVKMSKAYDQNDVQYSYQPSSLYREYDSAYA